MSQKHTKSQAGFTLIELLVAMAILLIIIMICAQIFQQARVAWSTGQDVVDMNMTGRAVADCIAQELAMAVDSNITISASSITFMKLGKALSGTPNTPALQSITYDFSGGYVTRNGAKICPGVSVASPRPGIVSLEFSPQPATATAVMPDYVDIVANVGIQDSSSTNQYKTRVYFPNRKRYALP